MAQETSERILLAALDLMKDRGFKAISVKEIAKVAHVSEMTVFRHFETKKGVLEAVVKKYSYIPYFKSLFDQQLNWDLEKDLLLIAQTYLAFMEKNKPIFLIAIQERTTMPELSEIISRNNTLQLTSLLATYFSKMMDKGKLAEVDTEAQAMLFLTTLFGYFVSTATWEEHFLHTQGDLFIETTVKTFARGIKK